MPSYRTRSDGVAEVETSAGWVPIRASEKELYALGYDPLPVESALQMSVPDDEFSRNAPRAGTPDRSHARPHDGNKVPELEQIDPRKDIEAIRERARELSPYFDPYNDTFGSEFIDRSAPPRIETPRTPSKPAGQQFKEGAQAFGRAFGANAANAAATPVTVPARLARFAGVEGLDAVADLDANEAYADLESLIRDEGVTDTRKRHAELAREYPLATTLGTEAGLITGGAAMGGVLGKLTGKAAGGAPRAAGVFGSELAPTTSRRSALASVAQQASKEALEEPSGALESGYLSGKKPEDAKVLSDALKAFGEGASLAGAARGKGIVRPIVEGSELAKDKRLGPVQDFLNEERASSSAFQRNGYPEAIRNLGAKRAGKVAKVTRDTQGALQRRGEPTTVFRGSALSEKELGALGPGSRIKNEHIWSAGTTMDRATGFAKGKAGERPVVFEIAAKTGVKADSIPGSNTFEEVLLPAGREFEFIKKRKENINGQDVTVVSVREE